MMIIKRSVPIIDAKVMRAINRSLVLEFIRCNGPLTRSHIVAELNANLPTVIRIVDDLIANGWIHEVGELKTRRGREHALLEFRGSDHNIIGIDLGGTKIYGAVVDFNGKIYHEMYVEHHQTEAEESVHVVYDVIDGLFNFTAQAGIVLSGIGIGVPGITIPETGIVSLAPALGWHEFPLLALLKERYSFPIVLENDVNLAALGEVWFGSKKNEEKNLILMAIGTGIGAGIVLDGYLHSGVHNLAGEIGYLLLDRDQLGQKYADFGSFEQMASGTGIANRARAICPANGSSVPKAFITAEDVFNAARDHESWAETIIDETIDYLALATAAVTLLYDPDVIVLGGGYLDRRIY